jgi:hypothetical protein
MPARTALLAKAETPAFARPGFRQGGIIAEGPEYNIWIPPANARIPSVKSAEVVTKPICCK